MLRLRTFGGCSLERDGTRLDGLSGQRKGLGLLALLAAAGDTGVSRDTAATYLWPESDEERAAASLKQLVHSIRQQLGSPDVVLGPATLRLNPSLAGSDVAEFKAAIQRGDADAAVAVYDGPFLDGFLIRGADTFERWVATERATLAAHHATALETLADRAMSRGDARGAADWWRQLQAVDPLNGQAAVGLMRALDAAGDRAGAIRHARVHEALLRQELGNSAANPQVSALAAELASTPTVAPPSRVPAITGEAEREARSAPTHARTSLPGTPSGRAWYRQRTPAMLAIGGALLVAAFASYTVWHRGTVERERLAAASGAFANDAAGATDRSIVVLPFANTSGQPADEPFADGLTDELIGALGRVAGLRVVPRTSAFALKGKGLDVRTMADTLGVATALEGSVRRAGDRLRITATLVRAQENRVIWSETYDRQVTDVFAVQREIADAVLRALQITLAPASDSRPLAGTTKDPVAYELYLRGQYFRFQLNGTALERAVSLFEQAIARDSAYARAHAGLADAQALLVLFGDRAPREGFVKARRSAFAALALDSMSAEAHAALGHIEMAHDWKWEDARRQYERALALEPASTTIRLRYGLWLLDQGRFDESVTAIEQTLQSDPLSTPARLTLGRIYVATRQPDRAIPFLNGAIELNPRLAMAHEQLGHALLQKKMPTEAIAAFGRAAVLSGVRDSAQLAYAYAVTGRRDEAQRIVAALVRSSSDRYLPPFGIAMAYTGLGDADEAFRWLERGFEEHASTMDTIAITTAFDPLHGDPRWASLLRRMGLAP